MIQIPQFVNLADIFSVEFQKVFKLNKKDDFTRAILSVVEFIKNHENSEKCVVLVISGRMKIGECVKIDPFKSYCEDLLMTHFERGDIKESLSEIDGVSIIGNRKDETAKNLDLEMAEKMCSKLSIDFEKIFIIYYLETEENGFENYKKQTVELIPLLKFLMMRMKNA